MDAKQWQQASEGEPLWIGIDLGATNAKAAVVTDSGEVVARATQPLDRTSPEGLHLEPVVAKLMACCKEAMSAAGLNSWSQVTGIGVGAPGRIDTAAGVVVGAANIFGGRVNVPLGRALQDAAQGTPTTLVNDANAAVAAELWVGVGRQTANGKKQAAVKDLIFLTLGTGVGASVVANGDIVSGAAACTEGGHMIIVANGRPCGCGQRGCLEAYTSAVSVVKRAMEALADSDAASRSALAAIPPSELDCKSVFQAAEAGAMS